MEKENKAGGLTHPDLKYIKKLQQLKKKIVLGKSDTHMRKDKVGT